MSSVRRADELGDAGRGTWPLKTGVVLEERMRALSTLARGITHEFNNILATIIGYVDLISQTESLSGPARRNLEIVRKAAARGTDLLKSLNAFSKKQAAGKELVSLKEVVGQVLAGADEDLKKDGIGVIVRASAALPPVVGNTGLLVQAVMSLVTNARHAMHRSAVKKLTIETGSEKGTPFIRVEDTGCGIPKSDIGRVFDPFYTTKGALACGEVHDGKSHGTGLGLSVCYGILEAHGGHFKIKSKVGEGTRFTIYLPAARVRQKSELDRRLLLGQGAARPSSRQSSFAPAPGVHDIHREDHG